MSIEADNVVASHPDLLWYENGQCALGGGLLDLFTRIDRMFVSWARRVDAREYSFPALLPASALARIDYFHSFPHLVTFASVLDADEENLRRFADGAPSSAGGEVRLTRLAPVHDVLTPAACYHCYVLLRDQALSAPAFLTTRSICSRRESWYAPLERQWTFSMREIVCVGTEVEVRRFLARMERQAAAFLEKVDLGVSWQAATDPFFDPSRNPRWVFQKTEPVKREMVYRDRLAIGSVNLHRDFFGEAFGIRRNDESAWSGCIAFGLERWLFAFLDRFGPREADWPLAALAGETT